MYLRDARSPGRRVLRVQNRYRAPPGLPGRQLDPLLLHMDVAAGMGDEETVAGHSHRQSHIVLLTDDEPLDDEVEEVLLIFAVKENHAAVQKIRYLDIVRLDRQRRIDHPTGEHGQRWQPMAGP